MAERRGGRKARLAGVNVATVLGSQPVQLKHLDVHPARGGQHVMCDLHQPGGFRHFARAGVLAAG